MSITNVPKGTPGLDEQARTLTSLIPIEVFTTKSREPTVLMSQLKPKLSQLSHSQQELTHSANRIPDHLEHRYLLGISQIRGVNSHRALGLTKPVYRIFRGGHQQSKQRCTGPPPLKYGPGSNSNNGSFLTTIFFFYKQEYKSRIFLSQFPLF